MAINLFTAPKYTTVVPTVEVVDWCVFAWPGRKRTRKLQFRVQSPERQRIRARIVEFYQRKYADILKLDGHTIGFTRRNTSIPWFVRMLGLCSAADIDVDVQENADETLVVCTYSHHYLNVSNAASGPANEVLKLAKFCVAVLPIQVSQPVT